METSDELFPGPWVGGILGGTPRTSVGYLIGIIFDLNKGVREGTSFGLEIGYTDVASLGMIYCNIWGRRINE